MITVSVEERPGRGAAPQPSLEHGVLVVDDDKAMRNVLGEWLRHQGYGVWTAETGREAVFMYKHYRDEISVVLIDVNMPIMDGPRTLVELREINPQVCCFFMNGKSASHTEADLLGLGAQGRGAETISPDRPRRASVEACRADPAPDRDTG